MNAMPRRRLGSALATLGSLLLLAGLLAAPAMVVAQDDSAAGAVSAAQDQVMQEGGAAGLPEAMTLASPVASPVGLPEAVASTPVGAELIWLLEVLNDGARALTPEDITTHFAAEFAGQVPAERAIALTQQVAAGGPFTLEGFTRSPTATQANALLMGSGDNALVVPIAVAAAAPHQITGVNFQPAPSPPGARLEPVVDAAGTPVAAAGRRDGLVDVDGRKFYLSCAGTGSPTVVLESGHNDPAAPWAAVEQAVAGFTRVCSYDRANALAGASDAAPTPRTGADAIADLHALLAAAGEPGPYVLVGHSLGGLYARMYASAYPDEVAGLVLVDATHEDQFIRFAELVSPEQWAAIEEAMSQFPDAEGIDLDATMAEARAAREETPLAAMPLVVVTAGQTSPSPFLPPDWPVEAEAAMWAEMQADLAGLVPNARHIIAEQSGHYVHQTEPGLVVDAVEDVVAAVRDSASWESAASGTPTAGTPIP